MAPKNKGKKSKKADDDDFWENAGESVANNNVSAPANDASDDESKPSGKPQGGFSSFAALNMDDAGGAEEEEDFGGLMSAIKNNSKGKKDKKDKKKNKKDAEPAFDDPPPDEGVDGEAHDDKKPVEVTAEDLADEEWGPVKEKGKKGKKGKAKKGKAQQAEEAEEDEELSLAKAEESTPVEVEKTEPTVKDDENAEDGGGEVKILSKKEKEKLKKEREKAKKKAQAAAKKAEGAVAEAPPSPAPAAKPDEEDEDEPEAEAGGKDSKKKKKKKAKKDEDSSPAPAAAPSKKKGGISALKALMEEKKRLEEEAKRAEEEERRRIEEEERKAAEEEKRKEEEKQRKKDKEKAKRELAKKEGRLLTKKQKEEKAAAEIRKKALLASGVQIEGLQGTAPVPKKPVYGNRKKKGPVGKDASPAPESRPRTPEPAQPTKEKTPELEPPANGAAKDDWDDSSEGEGAKPAADDEVKDSWDASSDEEEAPAPVTVPAAKHEKETKPAAKTSAPAKPAPANANGASKQAAQSTSTSSAPTKAPAKEESESDDSDDDDDSDSSEEEDSDEEDSDDDSSEEELSKTQKMAAQKKAEAAERRAKAHEAALAARSKDNLRSPICCILGHVDTGKTKLLDKIRQTNVQEGEAGGITQQIGATYFPVEAIKTKTAVMNKDGSQEYKIPGLLVIDTPGHESFTNLRSRGSSLCNIAILVVDIMHGLEAQTLESLRLLRDRKTPFIVALNKIDRMYGWQATPDGAFRESLAKQSRAVQREFEDRVAKTILAFAEEGLNAVLYYENKNFARNVSLVPTSAITGEGVPDMIMLLVNLTQQRMSDRLMYLSELECTVLEVKVIEGLGTTIDVVLSNGILREGDKIVICGLNGPIVTQVRALLTPQPLRELRIKSAYVHHKEVKAALGVKITAPDLDKAIAGSRLLVVGPDDDEDDMKEEVMSDLTSLLNNIDKSGRGVCVQASTLGSLEALLDFLKVSKIPVSGINIGPVHKKDVMRAGTMLERAKELAVILCFDVAVDKDAERMAEEMGIRIFKADIIYHLFDQFTAYNAEITEAKRRDAAPQAVWPCRLKIIAAFCKRDPIILGVDILDGSLRVGTPLAVVKVDPTTQKREVIDLGKVTSLEINHKSHDVVKKSQAGGGVAVKIEHAVYQSAKMFGRHFDDKDELLSHITRQSIDVLKASFKADVSNEEWLLIKALKPRFGVQ
ncbi:eukaryotic translation initiation factor 5B [Stygiomarasmius scandens]|uniref:Eukaryotic translation initiation factor 5B n=1 Tax=Marasmiellus scandens TaxID=2682957 RepID=A0ABR1K6M2_9AGAR